MAGPQAHRDPPPRVPTLPYARADGTRRAKSWTLGLWCAVAMGVSVVGGVVQSLWGRYLLRESTIGTASDQDLLIGVLVVGALCALVWPGWRSAACSPIVVVAVELSLFRRIGPSLLERVLDGRYGLALGLAACCGVAAASNAFFWRLLSNRRMRPEG